MLIGPPSVSGVMENVLMQVLNNKSHWVGQELMALGGLRIIISWYFMRELCKSYVGRGAVVSALGCPGVTQVNGSVLSCALVGCCQNAY